MRPAHFHPMLNTWLAVMLGGALGTGLRFWIAGCLLAGFHETVGTMAVNVLGSFVIGCFSALPGPEWLVSPLTQKTVMTGVLGGFTTFSAFSLQTLRLLEAGHWARAGANILLSVALCLVAVRLGQLAAHAFQR
jgi:CrcB protein